jgi:hypothetical protein
MLRVDSICLSGNTSWSLVDTITSVYAFTCEVIVISALMQGQYTSITVGDWEVTALSRIGCNVGIDLHRRVRIYLCGVLHSNELRVLRLMLCG